MISHDYVRNQYDNCIHSKKLIDGSFKCVVDDMLSAASSKAEIDNLKTLLSSEFEMKDLGATKKILGMEIWRDWKAGLLYLSQHKYIEKVLQSFQMEKSKPISTHVVEHLNIMLVLYQVQKKAKIA